MCLEVHCKNSTEANSTKLGVNTIYTMGYRFNTKIIRFSPPGAKMALQTNKIIIRTI